MQKPTGLSVQELNETLALYHQYHDYDRLLEHYERKGVQPEQSNRLIEGLKIYHKQKRHHRGVVLAAIGSILLIFGFILSIILYNSGMPIDWALFGPTTIGAVVLIWGMAELF